MHSIHLASWALLLQFSWAVPPSLDKIYRWNSTFIEALDSSELDQVGAQLLRLNTTDLDLPYFGYDQKDIEDYQKSLSPIGSSELGQRIIDALKSVNITASRAKKNGAGTTDGAQAGPFPNGTTSGIQSSSTSSVPSSAPSGASKSDPALASKRLAIVQQLLKLGGDMKKTKANPYKNASELCTDVDFTRQLWDVNQMNTFQQDLEARTRTQFPTKSVQQYLLDYFKDRGLPKRFKACDWTYCENPEDFREYCSGSPRAFWTLEAYKNYVAFYKNLNGNITEQLDTVFNELVAFPDIFATPQVKKSNLSFPRLIITFFSAWIGLAGPVGAVISAAASTANGILGFIDQAAVAPDRNFDIFSNLGRNIPDLKGAFQNATQLPVLNANQPAGDCKAGCPLNTLYPHGAFQRDDWISKQPSVTALEWDAFRAAIYGPFINFVWKQQGTRTVIIVRASKDKIGADPCTTDSLKSELSICDNGVLMNLVAVGGDNEKAQENGAYAKRVTDKALVPGTDKLGRYDVTVEDVIRSSWRLQQAHGLSPEEQLGDEMDQARDFLQDVLNRDRNNPVTSADRAQFTIPVCDVDEAMAQTSKDLDDYEDTLCQNYRIKDKAECKMWFAVLCRCPELKVKDKKFPLVSDYTCPKLDGGIAVGA